MNTTSMNNLAAAPPQPRRFTLRIRTRLPAGMMLAALILFGPLALAADPSATATTADQVSAYKTIGLSLAAAIAVGASILGAGYAVGRIGSAAIGAIAEKREIEILDERFACRRSAPCAQVVGVDEAVGLFIIGAELVRPAADGFQIVIGKMPVRGRDVGKKMFRDDIEIFQVVAEEGIGGSSAFYTTMANKLYEENPALRQIMPEGYIRSYMVAADCMPADQMELALKMINKAISVMNSDELPISERMMSQLKSHAEGQKLIVLNNLFRYSECAKTAEAVLDPASNFHRGHARIALLYVYAAALLYTEKADKALIPLREILKGNNKARQDIQFNAMLLELMVQFDLKNYALIPYLVSSVRKWIKRKAIPVEKSRLYLKWMLRIADAAMSGNPKTELRAFLEDTTAGKIKIETESLNIPYWLQNNLKGSK